MKLAQGKFNKHATPYWSPTLKAAHTHAHHLRRTWSSEDRARGRHHPSYLLYKEAKTQFRRQQRQHIVTNQNKVFGDLNKAADVDYRQFWKLLRKNTGRNSITSHGRLFQMAAPRRYSEHWALTFDSGEGYACV